MLLHKSIKNELELDHLINQHWKGDALSRGYDIRRQHFRLESFPIAPATVYSYTLQIFILLPQKKVNDLQPLLVPTVNVLATLLKCARETAPTWLFSPASIHQSCSNSCSRRHELWSPSCYPFSTCFHPCPPPIPLRPFLTIPVAATNPTASRKSKTSIGRWSPWSMVERLSTTLEDGTSLKWE